MKNKNIFLVKFAVVALAVGVFSPSVSVKPEVKASHGYAAIPMQVDVTLFHTAEARRGGGARRSSGNRSRSSNKNVNRNSNRNVNRNVNRNTNVNRKTINLIFIIDSCLFLFSLFSPLQYSLSVFFEPS